MSMQGTVKFFNENKGYGFIVPDDGSDDVFVHATAVKRAGLEFLKEGDKVSFDKEPSRKQGKGPTAENIKLEKAGS